ncbi:MAG: hypothetical protein WKF47_11710 [Geodermatophilaceae bacterium]
MEVKTCFAVPLMKLGEGFIDGGGPIVDPVVIRPATEEHRVLLLNDSTEVVHEGRIDVEQPVAGFFGDPVKREKLVEHDLAHPVSFEELLHHV